MYLWRAGQLWATAPQGLQRPACTFSCVVWDASPEKSYSREQWQSSLWHHPAVPSWHGMGMVRATAHSCVWHSSNASLSCAKQDEASWAREPCPCTLLLTAGTIPSPHYTGSGTAGASTGQPGNQGTNRKEMAPSAQVLDSASVSSVSTWPRMSAPCLAHCLGKHFSLLRHSGAEDQAQL